MADFQTTDMAEIGDKKRFIILPKFTKLGFFIPKLATNAIMHQITRCCVVST